MTYNQHFVRAVMTFVALCATSLLVTHFVEKFEARSGPAAWLFGAVYLALGGLWVADLLLTYRKIRYPCKGCNWLSAKLTKKKVRHGYSQDFYECEVCGHSEEAKHLGSW
jgi:hypothetical protein